MTTFRDWQLQNETCMTTPLRKHATSTRTSIRQLDVLKGPTLIPYLTFAPGQTPPVDGFWSLTLYNKEHLFAPNSLGRYSLGTKSKSMKENPDGSLTIYVQNSSPQTERETNWIPAPPGDSSLYIRAYWPRAEITEGTWIPPHH